MMRYRDQSIDRKAIQALVAVFGPREAARQAGLKEGTVLKWCSRYKWKKAIRITRTTGINGNSPVANKDAAQVLTEALQKMKEDSTLNLAKYVDRAAKQAAKKKDPLESARAVRDVSHVYSTLYPPAEEGEMIDSFILLRGGAVKDDPEEILKTLKPANAKEV